MKTHLLILAALVLASLSLRAQSSELALKTNDRVTINISGIPDNEIAQIRGVYTVSDNGTINLAHIREVRAAGLKPSSLQRAIQDAYVSQEIYTKPTVTVSIDGGDAATARMVYVVGGIKGNGNIVYTPGMTVLKAISAAGGFSPFARQSKTKLIRNGQTYEINLKDISSDPSKDMKLQPEDQIIVPE
ncbi:MAG: polysaccharide export protein [Verrucomicrobiaceae bacterium]|nr:polysaccharide export protein [Verrucomicrobiaceae bacterium]